MEQPLRQGRKYIPLTTTTVLFTPSGAPLASAIVKLYVRSWDDLPMIEPTTKLFDVCGVRSGRVEVGGTACEAFAWWRCLSPRPNPRPSVRARMMTIAETAKMARLEPDALRGISPDTTQEKSKSTARARANE